MRWTPGEGRDSYVSQVTTIRRSLRPFLIAALLATTLLAQGCRVADSLPLGVPGEEPARGSSGQRNPAIAKLDPELRAAVRAAIVDARNDGVRIEVTSGWRSRAHQERLLEEAVDEYGSMEEALRFVATPDASPHVTGDAVDIGPTEADYWLIQHGSRYGLCQIYANEIWHFELATTPGGECPGLLPDASVQR